MDHLYQKDSYVREFLAEITQSDTENKAIALNRTAFYPGGGGQPHDTGWVQFEDQKTPVIRVKKTGDLVWHYLDGESPAAGQSIKGILDWNRRYKLMRTHTALHILCGVVWRDYNAQVTGGNMEPLSARMDFEFENLRQELVHEIEEKINIEVKSDRNVTAKILPREDAFKIPDLIRTKINLLPEGIREVRIIEIDGLDLQADGGTHVAITSEIGRIKITEYKSKGKINKRIYINILDD